MWLLVQKEAITAATQGRQKLTEILQLIISPEESEQCLGQQVREKSEKAVCGRCCAHLS